MALTEDTFTGAGYAFNPNKQADEEKKRKAEAAAVEAAKPKKAKVTEPTKLTENPLAGKVPKIDLGSDVLNTIANVPTNLIEGVLNSGELLKDTVGTGINAIRGAKTPERDNPFSDKYVQASYDLGVQGPKSSIGKLADGILTFALGARLLGKAVPLKTGGLASGAIADFVLTKPEDGTLSTLIRDQDWIPPEMEDTFLLALAAKGDDNAWVSKLKAVTEGGVIGKVADATGWTIKAIRAGQAAKAAGKSDAQVLEIAGKVAREEQAKVDLKSDKDSAVENDRWDDYNAQRYNDLRIKEEQANTAVSKLSESFGEDSPEYLQGLDMLEGIQKELNDFDWAETRRADPQGLAPHEQSAFKSTNDINDVAASQLNLENNIPDAVKVDPNFKGAATSPTMGSSPRLLTDAFHKKLAEGGMSEDVQRMFRDFLKNPEIKRIAADTQRSVRQVVVDSVKIVEELRDAFQPANYKGESILEAFQNVKSAKATVNVDGKTMLSPEGAVAAKAIITDTSNQIFDLSTNLDQMAEIRMSGGNQFDRLVDRLTGMLELQKYYNSDKGFGLRVLQELPFGKQVGAVTEGATKVDTTLGRMKDWAEQIKRAARNGDPNAQAEMDKLIRTMVLAGGDPTKTVKFMELGLRVGWDSLLKGMYSSILSGPITHFRNAVGNTYALIERPLSVFIAGDSHQKAAAIAGFHAMRTSVSDAFEVFGQTLKTGESVQINRKFVLDDAYTRAALENMKMVAKSETEQMAVGFTEMLYNFHNSGFIQTPSRLLVAADDFFKHLNARQKVASDAMYKASLEGGGANNIEGTFKSYLKEYSKKINPLTGEIVDEDLLDYVQRATFQDDPGGTVGKMALFLEEVPFAKIFVPFVRTPVNILRYTAEHTPMLNRASREYQRVMEGSDELLKAEMRGREAMGKMVIFAAGTLSMSGLMTGTGPTDKEERKIWLQANQEQSLRVGNKWISYKSLEPLSTIMSVVADAGMLGRMGGQSAAEGIVGKLWISIMAACVDKSFLAGLSSLATVLDPKNITDENKIISGLLQTGNNFLPYAGVRRSLSNMLDPYVKEVDGELQKALSTALPLYKLSQPNHTDIFSGKLMEVGGGGLYNANSPFRMRNVNDNPVIDTLVDMGYEYNQITTHGPDGIKLIADEQAKFSKYIYEAGLQQRLKTQFEKPWVKESIKAYMDRPGQLDKKLTRHYELTDQIVRDTKKAAFDRLMMEDPAVYQRISQIRKGKYQAALGDIPGAVNTLQPMMDFIK
jgi:hypothetical protein